MNDPSVYHLSQTQVADLMGVSRSRVNQIEQRALAKIRAAVIDEAESAGVSIDEWLTDCRPDERPTLRDDRRRRTRRGAARRIAG